MDVLRLLLLNATVGPQPISQLFLYCDKQTKNLLWIMIAYLLHRDVMPSKLCGSIQPVLSLPVQLASLMLSKPKQLLALCRSYITIRQGLNIKETASKHRNKPGNANEDTNLCAGPIPSHPTTCSGTARPTVLSATSKAAFGWSSTPTAGTSPSASTRTCSAAPCATQTPALRPPVASNENDTEIR